MTPLEHNKYLGISHLAYGIIHILLLVVTVVFMSFFLSMIPARELEDFPSGAMAIIMGLGLVVNIALAFPSFVASYAFLKQKTWARVAGIIAAVVAAMHVPLGTAVAVYTFWFLFSDVGKSVYGTEVKMVPPPPPTWEIAETQTPPDWRS